jgi:hypothetical protein
MMHHSPPLKALTSLLKSSAKASSSEFDHMFSEKYKSEGKRRTQNLKEKGRKRKWRKEKRGERGGEGEERGAREAIITSSSFNSDLSHRSLYTHHGQYLVALVTICIVPPVTLHKRHLEFVGVMKGLEEQ